MFTCCDVVGLSVIHPKLWVNLLTLPLSDAIVDGMFPVLCLSAGW